MTTLEEDIKSFRNIIKCLKKYNSVGDKDPAEDFGYDSDDDEGSLPYNHYPELISCVTYNWNCIDEPKSCEEINDEEVEIEECNVFFHLTESRKPDKNGNPYFQSMKFWGGCCDFSYPSFEWDPELKIWRSESCGALMFFKFLKPFDYKDDPNVSIRSNQKSFKELGEHLRITEEGLGEWQDEFA